MGVLRDIAERRRLERQVLAVSRAEQERIGRDLHDTLGQELVGATYLARALEKKLAPVDAPLAAEAAKDRRTREPLVAPGASAWRAGLSPVDMAAGGLVAGLEDLARATREMSGIACRVTVGAGRRHAVPDHGRERDVAAAFHAAAPATPGTP